MIKKFDVEGMSCAACSAAIEKTLSKMDGVNKAEVNLITKSLISDFDESLVKPGDIVRAVDKLGYKASFIDDGPKKKKDMELDTGSKDELSQMKTRLIVSIVFVVLLLYVAMGSMINLPEPSFIEGHENLGVFAFLQLLLTLPIVYVNRKFYISGFKSLKALRPNMDSLVAIGSGAALVYGIISIFMISYGLGHGDTELAMHYGHNLYFESAATILTLITVGKFFEERSKGRTEEAIKKLIDLAPKEATVLRNGIETDIPTEDILVGDIVIIKPGEQIPVDGLIVKGSSYVDESALTGESMPVEKAKGDSLMSASVNKNGHLQLQATRVGNDTTLARIITLVEEAGGSKAPIAKIADKVSGVFVPIAIGIAVIASVIWLLVGKEPSFALSIGIAVLVISCPCALGLATPVAIMVSTGKSAGKGILIKSGEALEISHEITTVVLDKTGTITMGEPKVTDVISTKIKEEELVLIAASMEAKSEHPLGQAIVDYCEEDELLETDELSAIPGKGIKVLMEGQTLYAGNTGYMTSMEVDLMEFGIKAEVLQAQGKTVMFFARGKDLLGLIAVADPIKEEAKKAIEEFHEMGIEAIMLTGDNEKTAKTVADKVGIDRVIAEVLPEEKEAVISRLQEEGKIVAMVGDGINDSPALAKAHVGFAIGRGTDIAIEAADVVLMRDDLTDVPKAITLSKKTIKNIKQNLFWAFFYNAISIPIAAGVLYPAFGWTLSPMIAAAAMSVSSIFVVTNALRLYRD